MILKLSPLLWYSAPLQILSLHLFPKSPGGVCHPPTHSTVFVECLLCVRHIDSGTVLAVPLPLCCVVREPYHCLWCWSSSWKCQCMCQGCQQPGPPPHGPGCVNGVLGSGSSGEGSPSPVLAVARHHLGSGRALLCDRVSLSLLGKKFLYLLTSSFFPPFGTENTTPSIVPVSSFLFKHSCTEPLTL